MKKKLDRALDVPAEANRDKHINYLEEQQKANKLALIKVMQSTC